MKLLKKYKIAVMIAAAAAFLFIYQSQEQDSGGGKAELLDEEAVLMEPEPPETTTDQSAESQPEELIVDVKGEVKAPGVYEMKPGERYHHVIDAAGGLTEQADAAQINLAALLEDGMVVQVPKIGEAPNELTQQPAGAHASGAGGDKVVNLNKASSEELQTLTGIGPAKAEAIIAYREEAGGFKAVEDLMNVSGIGEKSFEKVKDSISVK
ncbi:helix-hairpin-helix domain-containing protein [Metabacillus indicus]|uniref:helix-hairpin-helix domain-containing protein n=1 Tax=Metabacillus indicus TaxID=246786 RepID=UPI002491523A|nr:helix-hairpin-helix domain-containing protein [Metabacillus indicus]